MGTPSCACIPPDGDDWDVKWPRICEYHETLFARLVRANREVARLQVANEHLAAGLQAAEEELAELRTLPP